MNHSHVYISPAQQQKVPKMTLALLGGALTNFRGKLRLVCFLPLHPLATLMLVDCTVHSSSNVDEERFLAVASAPLSVPSRRYCAINNLNCPRDAGIDDIKQHGECRSSLHVNNKPARGCLAEHRADQYSRRKAKH